MPKMVHDKVLVQYGEKHSHVMGLELCLCVRMYRDVSPCRGVVDFFFSTGYHSHGEKLDSRSGRRCRISSSCALCDIYKPIKAKCAVFERAGEVKSRVSLMPNCSH